MSSRTPSLGPPPTRLVGRERELADLARVLQAGSRIVTVLGPPGVGKSRLVAEHVARSQERRTLAFVADLTRARTTNDVCHVVAEALDVPLVDGRASENLAALLGERIRMRGTVLVVLDGFDHVARTAASMLSTWIANAPDATFIVTSRVRPNLYGEAVIDLGGLDEHAGRALFIERARAAQGGSPLDESEVRTVDEIVQRLDGIPLVIELAAARSRVMPLPELLEKLKRRVGALTSGEIDRPAHHQSLERALAWSWELLSDDEQKLLAWCAVFRGGFDAAAAEAIARNELARGADAEAVLLALRDRSLLQLRKTSEGALRLGLLEVVREHAEDQLERRGEALRARAAHARHYAKLGAELLRGADGRDAVRVRRRLRHETENLLAANRWAVDHASRESVTSVADVEVAVRTALALEPVLWNRGPLDVYRETLEASVPLALALETTLAPDLSFHLLVARARVRHRQGDAHAAHADLDTAERVVRDAERRGAGRVSLAPMSFERGTLAWERGDMTACEAILTDAVAQAREADDQVWLGRSLRMLARLEGWVGRRELACERLDEAMRVSSAAGDVFGGARATLAWCSFELDAGRAEVSVEKTMPILALARDLADLALEAFATLGLARAELALGHVEDALRHFEVRSRLLAQMGAIGAEPIVRVYIGLCYEELGRLDEAEVEYDAAIASAGRFGPNYLAHGLAAAWLGRLRATQGELRGAERALDEAAAILERIANPVLWETVWLCRGHLELAQARRAHAAGHDAKALRARRAAEKRLAGARASRSATKLDAHSTDVRIAARMLVAALARDVTAPAAPPEATESRPAAPTTPTWTFARNGRWMKAPGSSERIVLRAKLATPRLLVHLVARRIEEPGVATGVEQLFEVGWPGERAAPAAAANRIYVALFNLRGLGLREVLQRQVDGYLLDPNIEVAFASPASGSRAPKARARRTPSTR